MYLSSPAKSKHFTGLSLLMVFMAVFFVTLMNPVSASASPASKDHCTDGPDFPKPFDGSPPKPSGEGPLTSIAVKFLKVITQASQNVFKGIVNNTAYKNALNATVTLYIIIYGIMFMLGIANLTAGEGVVRLFKIAVLYTLVSPNGFIIFYDIVGGFFIGGMYEMINKLLLISFSGLLPAGVTLGSWSTAATPEVLAQPLSILELGFSAVFSAKMFVTLWGMVFTGPYGLIFAILLIMGIWMYIKAIVQAIWIFMMSIIVQMILLGLGPIFLVFLLFSKTKYLFDGWVNQLISYTLQPIFLFAFLGMYSKLIEAGIKNIILKTNLCWTNFNSIGGSIWDVHFWRFERLINPNDPPSAWKWEQNQSAWSFQGIVDGVSGAIHGNLDIFPVNIVDMLIFLLLAQLAYRYSDFVVLIAKDIAGSFVYLNQLPGSLGGYFKNLMAQGQGMAGSAMGGGSVGAGQSGSGGLGAMMNFIGKRK